MIQQKTLSDWAIELLTCGLEDEDCYLRSIAAKKLAEHKTLPEDTIATLIDRLSYQDEMSLRNFFNALDQQEPPSNHIIEALEAWLLKNEDRFNRWITDKAYEALFKHKKLTSLPACYQNNRSNPK